MAERSKERIGRVRAATLACFVAAATVAGACGEPETRAVEDALPVVSTTSTTTSTTTTAPTTTAPPTTLPPETLPPTTLPPTTVPPPPPPPTEPPPPVTYDQEPIPEVTQPAVSASFSNCSEARAAGAAPVYRGQPGYGNHLDRDGDGVGCEN